MKRLDDDFLDEPLWSIHSVMRAGQTFLDDAQFNAVDQVYRFVVLKRRLSVDALKAQENLPQPKGASYVPENEAIDRADQVAASPSALQHIQIYDVIEDLAAAPDKAGAQHV